MTAQQVMQDAKLECIISQQYIITVTSSTIKNKNSPRQEERAPDKAAQKNGNNYNNNKKVQHFDLIVKAHRTMYYVNI